MTPPDVVWTPGAEWIEHSNTARFMRAHGIESYDSLVRRSIEDPEWFWDAVVRFLGIPFDRPYERVRNVDGGLPWTTWFDGGRINLSVACVDRWAETTPDHPAVITEREDGTVSRLTFSELADRVGRLASGLRTLGVDRGDAVGIYVPMSEEAVIAFLAVARLGAVVIPIFSGYAAEAVAARLEDPRPAALVCADGFTRRGRLVQAKEIADDAIERAGGIPAVVVVPYAGRDAVPMTGGRDVRWEELLEDSEPCEATDTGSEDPVLLAYTSGTTGRPKGAVHVHGGLTVKLAEEGAFQGELGPGDRAMWVTDMGWIMGPWVVVAALANGATVVTYDGAPNHPGPGRIWEIAEKHELTFLGVSPTLIRALQPHGIDPARTRDLGSVRAFGSTGEPWNPDPWWWLFREVGGSRIPIVNLSGGTEIGACILSVNGLQGLKPTSLGGPALGMAAEVLDDSGRPVRGQVGELAVTAPWPSMTRGFWNEPERYLETYWSRFDDIWVHGDWASIDDDGFWYLHGRSDDTLSIAGKRVGPAEIESAAVALPGVAAAAAVGIPHPVKGETVAVFAVPAPGVDPTEELASAIADAVSDGLGKAFRPEAVRLVPDLPRTRSAKVMRRVIRSLALGEEPGDLSSLENPEALERIPPLG